VDKKDSRALRVLVVDDEPDTVLSLSLLLRVRGYVVQGAHGGDEALPFIRDFDPDAVILDINMHGMSGWQLSAEIRRLTGPHRPMLVAISGEFVKGAPDAIARKAAFHHYVTKPCEPEHLFALLAPLQHHHL